MGRRMASTTALTLSTLLVSLASATAQATVPEAPDREEVALGPAASDVEASDPPIFAPSQAPPVEEDALYVEIAPTEARLPVPTYVPPVAYPERALERGVEGVVHLRLVVDDEGQVREVEVTDPAGHGFDDLAAAAAWVMTFEPGRDERGQPVAAEITYAWTFSTERFAPLSLAGDVRLRGVRGRVAGAIVDGQGPEEQRVRTISDAEGRFRLAGLAPGPWTLTVRGSGLAATASTVDIPADDYLDGVQLFAHPQPTGASPDDAWDHYVEIIGRAPTAEVARRVISREEVVSLPGSLGDPVRAVQNLPGVSRAPFGSGQLLVRGTSADHTAYLLDGMPIPIAFHFSGISTVLSAELLDEIAFLPGSFGVRYGRAIGGVVDLKLSEELPERSQNVLGLDLFQASGFTTQRLGPDTAVQASLRRSYLDAVLNPILSSSDGGAFRAPRYYDAQLRVLRRLGSAGRLSGLFLLSDDRFRVLGDGSSTATDAVGYRTAFQKLQLRWTQPLDDGWRVETSVMAGPEVRELALDESGDRLAGDLGLASALVSGLPPHGTAREELLGWAARHEWVRVPGEGPLGVRIGADLKGGRARLDYGFGEDLRADTPVATWAAYLEPQVRVGRLQVIPGARYEIFTTRGVEPRAAFDPRASARLDLGHGVALTGGVGRFSQVPALREILAHEGPDLDYEHAIHASLGVEQSVGRWDLGLLGYRHTYDALVVGRDKAFRFDNTRFVSGDDDEPFANEGTGSAIGLEALIRYRGQKGSLWISGTVGQATRVPRPHLDRRPSEFDQPVILTVIGSRDLPMGLRLGSRVRLASGAPMTPVVGRFYSVDTGTWLPVRGSSYSGRAPMFFALDARIDREFAFRGWSLTTWIEVQNATNRRNVEIPGWSTDFSTFQPVSGLPVLPALGVRAAW